MGRIDFSTESGQRALERLESEQVIWLTTTGAQGMPQPSPVWFNWQDEQVTIYSLPNTPKLRAIKHNPGVALNFNCTDTGHNVVIFRGSAEVVGEDLPATSNSAYIEKYAPSMQQMGYTPEQFAAAFPVLIRVTPTHLRSY